MDMANDIKLVSVSFFRGVIDCSTIGFIVNDLFKIKALVDGLEPGDYRNWGAIPLWKEKYILIFRTSVVNSE